MAKAKATDKRAKNEVRHPEARDRVVEAVLRWDVGVPGAFFFDDPDMVAEADAAPTMSSYLRRHQAKALECGCPGMVLSMVSSDLSPWSAVEVLGMVLRDVHYFNKLNSAEGKEALAAEISARWPSIEAVVRERYQANHLTRHDGFPRAQASKGKEA